MFAISTSAISEMHQLCGGKFLHSATNWQYLIRFYHIHEIQFNRNKALNRDFLLYQFPKIFIFQQSQENQYFYFENVRCEKSAESFCVCWKSFFHFSSSCCIWLCNFPRISPYFILYNNRNSLRHFQWKHLHCVSRKILTFVEICFVQCGARIWQISRTSAESF